MSEAVKAEWSLERVQELANRAVAATVILSEHMPPSVNGLYANIAGRGRIKSAGYKTFLNAFGWDVKRQKPEPVHGHYTMSVTLSWLKRRPNADLSNRIKGLEDALVDLGVIDDDSLCDSLTMTWGDLPPTMAVRVEIEGVTDGR